MDVKFSQRLYEVLLEQGVDSEHTEENLASDLESDEDFPFECCFCAEFFFDSEKFKQHNCRRVAESDRKSHKCTFENCSKAFKKSSELRKHQRIHLNIRNFKCSECSCAFVHQTSLKNHLLTHSKIKSFVCSTCGLAFSTNGNLNQHKMKHVDESERRFRCDICDKRFCRSSNLKEHLTTHTKEKLFKCPSCDKTFSSSSSLAKHKKLHQGIKPYDCPFSSCDKHFTQNSHLQKHLAGSIHSEANSCDFCQKSFRRYDTLLNHLKTHKSQPKTIILSDEIIVPKSL